MAARTRSPSHLARRLRRALRRHGLAGSAREAIHMVTQRSKRREALHRELAFDREHGVDTAGIVRLDELAFKSDSKVHGTRYEAITPEQRSRVTATLARYGIDDPDIHWALIRLVFASPAVIAMIQVQDALGLGSEGRMNQPGSVGAWGWRLSDLPSSDVAARLREATEEAGRVGG